ncbi:MAG: hypothetical protein HFE83_12540 [Lachnospiraceae bacterium]|jgi:4-hydroxy-4-methyl-2-oxoglutarate aldolase|nr:hypothetical protein [Lachnospiraceae bacterium]
MLPEEKKKWIEEFKKYPTGNVSDAMDKLGIRRGAVLGVHPLEQKQPKAAGFALTVRQVYRRTAYDGTNQACQAQIIDTKTAEGDLLVIDMSGIMNVSTGGALLALRARMRGVMGELTNGCVRDADEIAALEFPVYCAGTIPVKSAMDIETVGVNIPVMIGGVQICPGDLILMDRTGVVCVPGERLAEILEETERICAREEKMDELIRQGHSIVEARGLNGSSKK